MAGQPVGERGQQRAAEQPRQVADREGQRRRAAARRCAGRPARSAPPGRARRRRWRAGTCRTAAGTPGRAKTSRKVAGRRGGGVPAADALRRRAAALRPAVARRARGRARSRAVATTRAVSRLITEKSPRSRRALSAKRPGTRSYRRARPVCAARKASWSAASPTVRLTARAPWPTDVSRRSTTGRLGGGRVLQGGGELAGVQRVDPGVGLERREQHRRVRRPLAHRVVRRVAEQPAELGRVRRRCRTRRSRCGPGRTARSGPCPAAARCRRRRRPGRAAGSASRRPAGRRWSRP